MNIGVAEENLGNVSWRKMPGSERSKNKIEKNIIESSKTDQQKSLKGCFAFGPCKKQTFTRWICTCRSKQIRGKYVIALVVGVEAIGHPRLIAYRE